MSPNLVTLELPVKAASASPSPARVKGPSHGVVGLVAAALALGTGLLMAAAWNHSRTTENGVTIRFQYAQGLRVGADLRYRGVPIGRVTEVRVRPDLNGVDVRVALTAHAGRIARQGSRFWIVRPSVSLANGVSGLENALGDKYMVVLPAPAGEPATEFIGSEEPPLPEPEAGSLPVVLSVKPSLASAVRPGAPVVCCGVPIGHVRTVELSQGGRQVRVVLCIARRHAGLVRCNSSFAPMNVFQGGSLLPSRIDLQALGGGVELKPAKKPGSPAVAGQEFPLSS